MNGLAHSINSITKNTSDDFYDKKQDLSSGWNLIGGTNQVTPPAETVPFSVYGCDGSSGRKGNETMFHPVTMFRSYESSPAFWVSTAKNISYS